MLIHWLMNKRERFLSVYQKSNAISLSTDSENKSDDPDYTKIPKMFAREHEKQDHALAVNYFFDEYLKEKHEVKDINLLNGVCSSKGNDNQQQIVHSLLKESERSVIYEEAVVKKSEIGILDYNTEEKKHYANNLSFNS